MSPPAGRRGPVVSGDPLLEAVRAIVARIAGPGRSPAYADRETRLSDGYWLDSIDLLKTVLACEAELGVRFDAETDFDPGHFSNLGTLTDLIRAKQDARRSGA